MRLPVRALVLALALGVAPGIALAQATQQAPQTAPKAPPAVVVTPPAAAAPATVVKTAPVAAPAGKIELIDINTASAAELEHLKGIGKVRAEAIVKGRPYKGKDELAQKNIVPQSVYDEIKDKIIAKQK